LPFECETEQIFKHYVGSFNAANTFLKAKYSYFVLNKEFKFY
jgi:hypothetical protein